MKSKLAILGSAFVIGLSGAMMPGPLLSASIGYTLDRGFWAGGPLLVLGHAVLELALVVLVLAGLGPLLSRKTVGAVIGVVGGAVLLWMGYGMASFAAGAPAVDATRGTLPVLWGGPVVAGILISLANPYWSLWWATIGLKYIALARDAGRLGIAAFTTGHILSDAAWYLLVAAAVAAGRRAVSPTLYRWLIAACGLVLIAFGILFLLAGARHLLRTRRTPAGEPQCD